MNFALCHNDNLSCHLADIKTILKVKTTMLNTTTTVHTYVLCRQVCQTRDELECVQQACRRQEYVLSQIALHLADKRLPCKTQHTA